MQATMTNMNVCETCYFHLVEYLGNIVKKKTKQKMSTTNLKTTTKQQEQIKRANKKIYFREQRTNQCQQTKRWAVLGAS